LRNQGLDGQSPAIGRFLTLSGLSRIFGLVLEGGHDMIDQVVHDADEAGDARKDWSVPRLRSIVPARRTRGGSGERNGDVDDIIYDLS
jgi:hypothetical protein